jgi:hypothetical protein
MTILKSEQAAGPNREEWEEEEEEEEEIRHIQPGTRVQAASKLRKLRSIHLRVTYTSR